MTFHDLSKGSVVLYKNKVEVRLDKETVWLTQLQMAELFDTERSVITKHLRNVFATKELDSKSNVQKMHVPNSDKPVQFYSLNAIISVGYRVNSMRGTHFRIWATQVLRKHLVDGFTINEKRLRVAEHKYLELQRSIKLLGNVMHLEALSDEAKGLVRVITEYSRALDLLDNYDHGRLTVPQGLRQAKFKLTYDKARNIIEIMKRKFKDSPLVGQEKDSSFKSSLGTIYQTFSGRDLYPTVEEKAAHLLYFVTKNHSFIDGNKRIAAALFVCFLQRNHVLLRSDRSQRIENNALAALTLMIAASKPAEKETMINVILNVLA